MNVNYFGDPMSREKGKTLILCVDRDNDVGEKAGVKTPILGRDLNLEAASTLALNDPEESDANAMFGALRVYDSLSKELGKEEYEVATIAGSELGGVKADRRLRDQLISVLEKFPAENVVLVTDGFSDEEVIPIIQSKIPILSIRRVVVKHSQRIEESWAVLSRYLERLMEDRYYARWVLGVPGVLIIALATLWLLAPVHIGIFLLLFIGTLFVIKGFGVDRKIVEFSFPTPLNLIRIFTTATSLIIVGICVYQTTSGLITILGSPYDWWLILPSVIGYAVKLSVDLLVIAFFVFLVGLAVYSYFTRDLRIWWIAVGVVAALWMREVALKASEMLLLPPPIPESLIQGLILIVGLGVITAVITIFMTLRLGKKFNRYFRRSGT
jgi:uncharacterized membrane protein